MKKDEIPSPCHFLCRAGSGRCVSCHRTIKQIRLWRNASEKDKEEVWREIISFGYKPRFEEQIKYLDQITS